jgi:hypothetical protein
VAGASSNLAEDVSGSHRQVQGQLGRDVHVRAPADAVRPEQSRHW